MKSKISQEKLPKHIGVIMDGNGRWAAKRLLPRSLGHHRGVKTLEKIIDAVTELEIPYFTVYAFSTENQKREQEEIDSLVGLIRKFFVSSLSKFIEKGVRIRILGDRSYFSDEIQKILTESESKTAACCRITVAFALNYGARNELIRAINHAVQENKPISEETFPCFLDTAGMPDPDMIIRTGGEMRLSNFLLYQSAYSELFFVSDLWPDFTKQRLYMLVREYAERTRKFGK